MQNLLTGAIKVVGDGVQEGVLWGEEALHHGHLGRLGEVPQTLRQQFPLARLPSQSKNLKRTSSCLISEELHEVLTKSSHNFHHTHTHTDSLKKKKKKLILIFFRKPGGAVKLWRQELSGSHPSAISCVLCHRSRASASLRSL